MQSALCFRNSFQKCVKRRRSAPLQIFLILFHQIPETSRIGSIDSFNSVLVSLSNRFHLIHAGLRGELVSVADAHMRHVDTENPEQPGGFPRGDLSKGRKETLHAVVIFRNSVFIDASGERSAKDGEYAYVGPIDGLQEDDLKLD